MDRKLTSDNTTTTIPRHNFMGFFLVFKMAMAIAFLCKNAVNSNFCYFYVFELKWLLQHVRKETQ